jgi:hypothetical protein
MAMTFKGFRGWVGGGVLAAALLGSACGMVTRQGGPNQEEPPQSFFGNPVGSAEQIRATQNSTDRGYNGTIQDIGSSIDPRTPENAGTPDRSLPEDLAWARLRQSMQGVGGAGAPGGDPATDGVSNQGPAGHLGPINSPTGYIQRFQREGMGTSGGNTSGSSNR